MNVSARIEHALGDSRHKSKYNLFTIITFTPAIILLTGLFVIPLLFTVNVSLHEATLVRTGSWVGLQNYVNILSTAEFWSALMTGTVFAIGSVAVQLTIGLVISLLINMEFKGSFIARTLAIFPYLIPTVVVMSAWQWMMSPSYGILNQLLVYHEIVTKPIPFFSNSDLALPSLIIVGSWKFTSFVVIILLARLQSIDPIMYEQAKISGASKFQMFRDITLPNLRGAIFLVVLLRSIWMFNHFDLIWLLTKGGPFGVTTNLPVLIYQRAIIRGDLALGSSAAIILFIILLITSAIYFKVFRPSEEVATSTK